MKEVQVPCPKCEAKPGELHKHLCDVEQCMECGGQLLICLATRQHGLSTDNLPTDGNRGPWTGEWPGVREAFELGWFTIRNPDGPGYVTCSPYAPGAEVDLHRVHEECVWDKKLRRFVIPSRTEGQFELEKLKRRPSKRPQK